MPIDPHLLALFTVTTIVAMITPGPDMLFVLGCGMRGGPRAGLLATAGVATSEAVHVAVAAAAWRRCSRRCRSPSPWYASPGPRT
ncbi:hypothetical protein ACFQQB_29095 [Nonomuraea rubra]|uniref:hypothetical protein n=1 Tax=Nonomuraea rubra TaxID=46180 RepID=UPI003606D02A